MNAGQHNFRALGANELLASPQLDKLDPEFRARMHAVAAVLPFRANPHTLELINWSAIPRDPIFQLTFPQPGMLEPEDEQRILNLIAAGNQSQLSAAAFDLRRRLNPHPAGQLQLNIPILAGRRIAGLQHKYRETVLWFPAQGQTCHAFCSFCFRWPQFVGVPEWRQANSDPRELHGYLSAHPEVSDLLLTGGDPLFMRTKLLARHLEPLLSDAYPSLRTIRIGTKALSFWPYRFTDGAEADSLMRLFERIVASGRHLALMAHFVHPRELEHDSTRRALARVRATGAIVRCQGPIVRHINDSAEIWAELWQRQVDLGLVPYYMFVARDTGPRHYFEVPLIRAHQVFTAAYQRLSGLARTVRGPSMSTTPGKIVIDGIAALPGTGEQVFILRFIQAREPSWVGRPFFAAFDASASWLDHLRPADGSARFFFDAPAEPQRYRQLLRPGALRRARRRLRYGGGSPH